MSESLTTRLLEEIEKLPIIDAHSHIVPQAAASTTLTDLLGYHYFTELVHSAGVPRAHIEDPALSDRDKCSLLVGHLPPLFNTVQYSWLVDICRAFFELPTGVDVTPDNFAAIYDTALQRMSDPAWEQTVIERSNLEAVFLTNDFDDPLTGFDTSFYVPCLRTDDLVFKLHEPRVRERLMQATGIDAGDAGSLRAAIGKLFEHFVSRGARACAISLPPDFAPTRPTGDSWLNPASDTPNRETAAAVFWMLAEFCDEHKLPFDLMIGVNRQVYRDGVFQGQDLYDSRVSLIQYRELFNAFPAVTFPVSVLASVTNQELVSYAWIFPNVVTNGHWWYSNTPTFIERDLAARLEAVPATKQIGYYSDMYKLEFALPKFGMYKRILARVLAQTMVIGRGWSEQRAVDLAAMLLKGNVEQIFYR
jgi:glucuronate isomerase